MSLQTIMVRGLSFQYQPEGLLVLKDVDFQVAQGEAAVITGLSGCGKSTLCYCLSGVIRRYQGACLNGDILINGKDIRDIRLANLALEVGMVFQDPDTQLFSPTVEDEIAFGPENLCIPPQQIRQRVDQVLELLQIEYLREANPYRLSGGEKHLVALASVLALDPAVLLLDEVMSQLDASGKARVSEALTKLREMGKTIIAVEHILDAVSFADRMLVMESGHIIREDRTDVLLMDTEFMTEHKLIY